jgi:hypothetical protein
MKLKVVSDGTAHGSKITHSESGELLGNVQSVDLHLDVQTHLTHCSILTTMQEFVFEAEFVEREKMLEQFVSWLEKEKGILLKELNPNLIAEHVQHLRNAADDTIPPPVGDA